MPKIIRHFESANQISFFIIIFFFVYFISFLFQKHSNLANVNTDIQWLILDQMSISDSMKMAEVNQKFLLLTQNAVGVKLKTKTVIFSSPYSTLSNYSSDIKETDDSIQIKSYPTISKFLEFFGELIENLKIIQSISDKNANSIYEMVHRYCNKTLREITLDTARTNFTEWPAPYERVEVVNLGGYLRNLLDMKLNLNEMFPSMKELKIRWVDFLNTTDKLVLEYPLLEVLEVDVTGQITENIVNEIVRKNLQIKVLIIHNASDEYKQFVRDELSEELGNLEKLEFIDDAPQRFLD